MIPAIDLRDYALVYHQRLPKRLWKYLNARGIPDTLIHKHLLGWNGRRITIPIPNREGKIAFFKLARDPDDNSDSPKMLATPGARAELYGWEPVLAKPEQIIICEGEFDRLVLEGQGFAAVTSTGGAGVFHPEWAEELKPIPEVYLCFDRDAAGKQGALRVGRMVPHAKLVGLPEEVGESGDVTDFFVRLGHSREDFLRLLEAAQPLSEEMRTEVRLTPKPAPDARPDGELGRLKSQIAIVDLIARYVPLRPRGQSFVARCPFHDDHDPSFVVFPATQTFYCFGCRASGDVAGFLMRKEHLTFPEALRVLRDLTR
jgi:DNA primase